MGNDALWGHHLLGLAVLADYSQWVRVIDSAMLGADGYGEYHEERIDAFSIGYVVTGDDVDIGAN